MKGLGHAGPHELGEPLNAGAWEAGTLLPIANVTLTDGWTLVDMVKDPVTGADSWPTRGMLRDARKCDHAGESITVRFNGTAIACTDVPGTEPIVIETTVDGGQPVAVTRVSNDQMRRYARYWWTGELPPGDHTVKFTVKTLPAGVSFYAGQFRVVGKPSR